MKKQFSIFIVLSFLLLGFLPTKLGQSNENDRLGGTNLFSTYLGGSGDELASTNAALEIAGITIDSEGNTIIVGRTESSNFTIKNAFQSNHSGGSKDVIVAKFSSTGTLLFSTYFGGSRDDWATNVVTDSENNIYFVGSTLSTDFPLTSSAFQSSHAGGSFYDTDAFIVKMGGDGQDLLYSSYFGGTGDDWGYGIDVDSENNIAICGSTYSDDLSMDNSFQETIGSTTAVDAYIAKIDIEGNSLLFASYLGDTLNDWAMDVIFDSEDNAIIVGGSMSEDFPTKSAYNERYQGGIDAICAKFSPSGELKFSTFIGGTGSERTESIAVDAAGDIVIGGSTQSDDFPLKKAYQDTLGGSEDAFILKLCSNGRSVRFSTYLGGSSVDVCAGVAIDSNENIIVTGKTSSSDFPILNASQKEYGGGSTDGFYAVFGALGNNLYKSSYFGGSASDVCESVAVSSEGTFSLVGFTQSTNLASLDAAQSECQGKNDYIVASFSYDASVSETVNSIPGYNSLIQVASLTIFGFMTLKKKKY